VKRPGGFDRPADPPEPPERPGRRGPRPAQEAETIDLSSVRARRKQDRAAGRRAGDAAPSSVAGTSQPSSVADAARAVPVGSARTEAPDPAAGADPLAVTAVLAEAGERAAPAGEESTPGEESTRGEDATPGEDAQPGPGASPRELRAARRRRLRAERREVRRFTGAARRRRRILLVCAGAVLALAGFVLITGFTPIMAVRTIDVVGTSRLSADAVRGALQGQLGVPLTLVDDGSIRSALAAFPEVESFAVEERPPSTLRVSIVERAPIASVVSPSGGFDLVDAAGVVLQHGAERPAGYPLAVDVAGNPTDAGFAAMVPVLRSLPPELLGQIDTVTATGHDDVSFVIGSIRVVWGSADDSALKSVILQRIMGAYAGQPVSVIDVSSTQAPVLQLAG